MRNEDQKNKITKTNEGDDLEKIIANASKPSDSSEKKPNLKRKRKVIFRLFFFSSIKYLFYF